ncbi:pyridoxamine 5'-phosphate oxidase family protein [Micromonospora sp. NBC_01739]|uniref:pyridoxamine 5'-phosphate oxidase family protein n=1 Tax=Micromonospora sp. NBC_01739 TaxID=2975985 RepID=UPI002E166E11|nr:pyridoxamine 5'-phosphate oxidase family protein [Micromonospora sp. NBC_01739]
MSDEPYAVRAARQRITELIRAAGTCTLTTISLDGRLVGRPMLLQRAAFAGELWFFAYSRSATVRQLRVNPEVEVSLTDPGEQVRASLSGTARDDHDPARATRLWQPELAVWFPQGPATAGLTLVAVHLTAARCWDRAGLRGTDLLGAAGSAPAVVGVRPDEATDR